MDINYILLYYISHNNFLAESEEEKSTWASIKDFIADRIEDVEDVVEDFMHYLK